MHFITPISQCRIPLTHSLTLAFDPSINLDQLFRVYLEFNLKPYTVSVVLSDGIVAVVVGI